MPKEYRILECPNCQSQSRLKTHPSSLYKVYKESMNICETEEGVIRLEGLTEEHIGYYCNFCEQSFLELNSVVVDLNELRYKDITKI